MAKKNGDFNKKTFFNNNCAPLIEKLEDMCRKEGIPLFITAAVSNNVEKGETKYENFGVMTGSNEIVLADDHIKHHMMISSGCIASPRTEDVELSIQDFIGDGEIMELLG